MPSKTSITDRLLSLPITLTDYLSLCRKREFDAIESISRKLLNAESGLVDHGKAKLIVNNALMYLISLIPHYLSRQIALVESFTRTCKHFGGKSIFLGFIRARAKYLQGAIVPAHQEEGTVIIYLPIPPNLPRVLYSPCLNSQRAVDLVAQFVDAWKHCLIRLIRQNEELDGLSRSRIL